MIVDAHPWFAISRWILPCNEDADKSHTVYMSPRWGIGWDSGKSGVEVILWVGRGRIYIRRRSNVIMALGHKQRWFLDYNRRS